jgi:hypothetical protein
LETSFLQRKQILEIIKETVLGQLSQKCPSHVSNYFIFFYLNYWEENRPFAGLEENMTILSLASFTSILSVS